MIKVAQQALCGPCWFIITTTFFESSVRYYVCYIIQEFCISHTNTHILHHITCVHLFH